MINSLLEALIVIGPLLGSIAYVTIAERKIMGSMQRRIGPNKVGQCHLSRFCQVNNYNNKNNNNTLLHNSLLIVNTRFYSTSLTKVKRSYFFIIPDIHEIIDQRLEGKILFKL